MLTLLKTPAWAADDAPPRLVPMTVPGALLVVLGASGAWTPRERLAAMFWPDAAPADALHHLRVNLHRARAVLARWGLSDALQVDRQRLRLALPTDVAPLYDGSPCSGPAPDAANWPPGWHLGGYDGFTQWCRATGQDLHRRWLHQGRPPPSGVAVAVPAAAPPGRQAEHRRLIESRLPALLLLGEAGAGKTTLLGAAFPQVPCLRGLEGLHGMPYRPLLDALRARLEPLRTVLRDASSPLRAYRLDLARMLPELAPDEALPPLDALTARTRLVEALARAFEALSPVLVVDDLQWCDTATVEWLLMLAHADRLRWRAAARRSEIGPALAESLQPLRAAGKLQDVDVVPLSRGVLAAVCAERWPQTDFTARQLDRLHVLSGGNPFALGEWVAAGVDLVDAPAAQPGFVHPLLQRRLHELPPLARLTVQAAAVYVHPVPEAGLRALVDAPDDDAGDAAWALACQQALAAGMLCERSPGLACAHDLIRETAAADIAASGRAALHRRAALWLAQQPAADELVIAEHWRAAQEPQTALAWCHRGAEQLKARGRFSEALALWNKVADESLDATQSLRARLELAACDLFEDLARGETALAAVQAQLDAVADPEQHRQIEGRLLAARVDNRVFAGDIAGARKHAARLRVLLPGLPEAERIDAGEVLIELAMREPDIPAAWKLLGQLRQDAPRRPTLLSFEGQIHWFGGQVQAAHDALARLLQRHPDHCRGITIENDLAVMLHALGETAQAEEMARRSLNSWAGVAHTETLSQLVLGSVLTSAGRHHEAEAALQRALALATAQSSSGFEAEAQVRLARLMLQCGRLKAARQALAAAAPMLCTSSEPLRVSQWVLVSVLTATEQARPPVADELERLRDVAANSSHPLVLARLARVEVALALARGDAPAAVQAAERQVGVARDGGLKEWLAEGWLLEARARQRCGDAPAVLSPRVVDAAELAARQGFVELDWRANAWLAAHGGAPEAAKRARAALAVLRGRAPSALFNAAAAAKREPRWG